MIRSVLVSAGEASGDALAAAVVRALPGRPSVYGLGGDALVAAGAARVVDLGEVNASGLGDVVGVIPAAARALGRLGWLAERRHADAALLVDFTSFHARLGRWLRARGVPVVWAVAPQLWAWRPERGPSLARAMSRLGVLFAFEVEPWRRLGVDAHWVGHPALDRELASPAAGRAALGLSGRAPTLALLPGSRPGEVRRLLGPMLEAARRLAHTDRVESSVLLAPTLRGEVRRQVDEGARRAGVRVVDVRAGQGMGAYLPAFDAALCASGTATLECALAGARPVITYRVDALTALAARRWLRTEHVGLPNVVLGRRAFAERLQGEATAGQLAASAREALGAGRCEGEAAELRERLDPGDGRTTGERLAALLAGLTSC